MSAAERETPAEEPEHAHPAQALATYRPPGVSLVPQTTAQDLVQRLDVIRGAMEKAMVDGVDYGKIPGVNKPTLLKPGAEKLGVLFQFDVQIENEKHWHDDGHLTVISHATVFHAPSGTRMASGEGICSSRETKYAYRQADRICPNCGKPAIIKGKAEYGGGWLCWRKKDGCDAKFRDDDPAIAEQPAGKVPNDSLPDTYNTIDKMASKRARIDAILAATGASALFTQDAEDLPKQQEATEPPAPPRTTVPAPERPQAGTASARKVTDRQLTAIHTLASKLQTAGLVSEEQFRAVLKVDYQVDSSKDLTNAKASELIERLKAREKQLAGGDTP